MSVFSDSIFRQTTLSTVDGTKNIVCTLKQATNSYLPDLLRNDSKTILIGRCGVSVLPVWLVPGTILYGVIDDVKMVFTYDGVVQSRIQGLTDLLGARVKFSVVIVTEFP